MVNSISQGIKISVETFYQPQLSMPVKSQFQFAYLVTIQNHQPFSIKLQSRSLKTSYADGSSSEIHGEQVPQVWPSIEPGKEFRCLCLCQIHTEIGRVQGAYTVERADGKLLKANIPAFDLVAPVKCN